MKIMLGLLEYAEVTALTPTKWQKDYRVAVLAFSLNAAMRQKTHLKWERAIVRLTIQTDSTRKQGAFLRCLNQVHIHCRAQTNGHMSMSMTHCAFAKL